MLCDDRGVPRKRPAIAFDTPLVPAVTNTLQTLQLGPADAAVAALALTLARSLDGMTDEMRAKMAGQTSGALLRVLEVLAARSAEATRAELRRSMSGHEALGLQRWAGR